jgi:multidrug efflux pump subunit AcrB
MLPLILMPGEGSVIYRGLATAIAGGMTCSLFFTLLMLPALLRLGAGARDPAAGRVPQPALESAH